MTDTALARRLQERLGDQLLAPVGARHDTTEIWVGPGQLTSVMTTLHDDPDLRFELLADLAGVDTGGVLQVVYHLWSPLSPDWLRVICDGLPREDPRLPSVTFLWNGAEWAEREAWDMFGLIFEGNRDLRRIYMPPDYESFPLRKDFLMPDDASRSPGLGVRPMEEALPPADPARVPVLRSSAGAGSLWSGTGTQVVGPGPATPAISAGGDA
ncbi:MAG: NADH-quinone oxidoreductase subunit C [Chloroflexi bacterium]|nr:NADH-quinone oxidoreductase subunit C [Chloroflexota bacterium]